MTNMVSSGWKSASLLIAGLAVFCLVWAILASRHVTQLTQENIRLGDDLVAAQETVLGLRKAGKIGDDVVVKAAQAKVSAAKSTAKQQEKVSNALSKHPEWADEPIPADVLDSLR